MNKKVMFYCEHPLRMVLDDWSEYTYQRDVKTPNVVRGYNSKVIVRVDDTLIGSEPDLQFWKLYPGIFPKVPIILSTLSIPYSDKILSHVYDVEYTLNLFNKRLVSTQALIVLLAQLVVSDLGTIEM